MYAIYDEKVFEIMETPGLMNFLSNCSDTGNVE
jgi:hypothetical protein